jgi:hypothetical protein
LLEEKIMTILVKVKKIIKQFLLKIRERLLWPVVWRLNQQEEMLLALSDTNLRTRAMLKRVIKMPINVLFVCHEPALWSMFETVYHSMLEDQGFNPLVVTLPYKHWTLPEGHYKDAGMMDVCRLRKIKVISGYNEENNEWLNPASLMPDYVFFQTPYTLYHKNWSVEQISMMARVCYIPYATCLFKGEIDDILHPASFFKYTGFIFKESPLSRDEFLKKFQEEVWLKETKVILCGHPKLDYLNDDNNHIGKMFRRGTKKDITRILWTPRWNTSEGNCHFFDYKDFFILFCKEHQDVDFTFRPHPLCLQNFLRTGELTESDLAQMERDFDNSQNMNLDKEGDYQDTFLASDILVSDISSMMLEYFGTGKPIVYTHRIDVFNELGRKLSEGFYWVNNATELKATLEMLISGNDPLSDKRKELKAEVLFLPKRGSGLYIKELIRTDYYENILKLDKVSDQ